MSAKAVKERLIAKAIREGREEQMSLLIEWRSAYIDHLAGDRAGFKAFMENNGHEHRSIRYVRLMGYQIPEPERTGPKPVMQKTRDGYTIN